MKAVRKRSAFTLLEMVVVVLLLAVISSVGFLSVRSSLAKASRQNVISQIIALDAQERAAARSNPAGGQLQKVSDRELRCRLSSRTVRLPPELKISRLLKWTPQSKYQSVSDVSFVLSGNSPTYVVEIADVHNKRWWVAVLGISGQAFEIESETELLALTNSGARR